MKIIRSILPVLFVALFTSTAATSALAADELAQIKQAGVFRIGTEGTYAPFTYHDASGRLTGFDVEIGTAIARRLGVKPQFVEGKWDGLIAGLDANRYDAVINEVGITSERKARYDFSTPYIVSRAVLITRTNNSSIRNFNDLEGKKSAQSLTSNYSGIAMAHGAQIVQVQGFNEAIDLLLSGRVDATVNDALSFLDFKKHKPDAPLKIVATDTSGDASRSAVLLRKGNPALRAAIDKALAGMKADGTYARISYRYFGKDVSQ